MEGITTGIPKRTCRPVVDGIVEGVKRVQHSALPPPMEKVTPSATKNAENTFGSGKTPQGVGNGGAGGVRTGGMRTSRSMGMNY